MRTCLCKAPMEFVGHNADGRYWCPECGRYSQSYVAHPTVWRTPKMLKYANRFKRLKGLKK